MEQGASVLTVFAFSSENWDRPEAEVSGLMELMAKGLAREIPQLHESGVRVQFLGDRDSLSASLQNGLLQAEALTVRNQRFRFNVCFNYGGQWDIVQAAQKLASAGQRITVQGLSEQLSTAGCGGDPDLLIRTGGEMRLSNFLLWQAAYSELVFSEKLWPDFDETDLALALTAYRTRERRFGKTSEQVRPQADQ
jgi:undecaprenyl diphosphate synthase